MQIKGIGLITTRDFVKTKFPSEYESWLNTLPPATKVFYSGIISASQWYPFKEAYLGAMKHITDKFFKFNVMEASNQLGQFSAEAALKGIYKVFLLVASPGYLLKRSTNIFYTYYSPSEIEVVVNKPNYTTLRITKFDDINLAFEYRFGAWCKKAVELTNKKNVKYSILKSMARGDAYTEVKVEWM